MQKRKLCLQKRGILRERVKLSMKRYAMKEKCNDAED
jgi:hypothetical protein